MFRIFCFTVVCALASTSLAAEPTFDEILTGVMRREPRTGAIWQVRAPSRVEGSPKSYSYFEIQIKGKTAHVEMYNSYLTGRKGERFTFPVGPKIKQEYDRLQNLAELQKLDKAVADAERRQRIFVLSSFKLKEGSDLEHVEAVFGKPTSFEIWMRAGWRSLKYPEVEVVMGFDKVHDIRKNDE